MIHDSTGPLKTTTKLAFGVGQTAEGIKTAAFSMFVVLYYNQVLGLDPGLAGLAAGLALAFDAVTDPLAGALSDSFQSRWGRRHPFMVMSSVPLAVSFILLFAPPEGLQGAGLFTWLLMMAVLVRGSITFYQIPHLALGAELSRDYTERTAIFTYSTMFGYVGGFGMRTVALPVFFPSSEGGLRNPAAYGPFAATLSAVMLGAILLCVWGTRKRIPYLPQATSRQRFSFGSMLRMPLRLMTYRSFRSLFFGMLLTTFVVGIEVFMYTYMGIYFWNLREEQLGVLGASMLVSLPLSFIIVPAMTRRLDKRNALVASAIVAVLATNIPIICRLVGAFPDASSPLLLPLLFCFGVVYGVISPALWIVPQSMFADIGDEVALATGERVEGLIFAARSFIGKGVYGLGTMAGGIALKLIQFPDKAVPGEIDPAVVFNLGMVQGPLTSIFTLVGVAFYLSYPLTEQRHKEIQAALARQMQKQDAEDTLGSAVAGPRDQALAEGRSVKSASWAPK